MSKSKFLLLGLVGFTLTVWAGCVINSAPYKRESEQRPSDWQANSPLPVPTRGKASMDWGLALSGGGIRSGTFSLGVLKALSDNGVLDEIDIVSTVSGGGYAWFWLLTQDGLAADDKKAFGYSVFQEGNWLQKTTRLSLSANFVPYRIGWRQIPFPPVYKAQFYEERLNKFAYQPLDGSSAAEACLNSPTIGDYADKIIRSGRVPAFVINATLHTEAPSPADLLEFTPFYVGNDYFGYRSWAPASSKPLVKTIAISGAAVPTFLAQKFPDPIQDTHNTVTAWDGGGGDGAIPKGIGENLGAYALIRRNLRNVIIVDGEHDPANRFEAYHRLRHLLALEGIALSVDAIDHRATSRDFTAGPLLQGRAVRAAGSPYGGPIDVKIHYLKLSLPERLFKLETYDAALPDVSESSRNYAAGIRARPIPSSTMGLSTQLKQRYVPVNGAQLGHEIYDKRQETVFYRRHGRWYPNPKAISHIPPLRSPEELEAFYAYAVARYATFLNFTPPWRAQVSNRWELSSYRFPQIGTTDQSFYLDQFEAFLGLGYLHGRSITLESAPVFACRSDPPENALAP